MQTEPFTGINLAQPQSRSERNSNYLQVEAGFEKRKSEQPDVSYSWTNSWSMASAMSVCLCGGFCTIATLIVDAADRA